MRKVILMLLVAIIVAPCIAMGRSPQKSTTPTTQTLAPTPDTAKIYNVAVPILLGEEVNPMMEIELLNNKNGAKLTSLDIEIGAGIEHVESVALYYTGTASMFRSRSRSLAMIDHFAYWGGGQKIYKSPAHAIFEAKAEKIAGRITLRCDRMLFVGQNRFYVSLTLKKSTPLEAVVEMKIGGVTVEGSSVVVARKAPEMGRWRAGVSVRNAWDDGIFSYRIPALVTAKNGDLLAAYDIRRYSMQDLQEDVQVGLSRSTDGGRNWLAMQTIIDMRGYGGLPDAQNGVGDPALLVDQKRGTVWAIAMWTHGIANDRAWWTARQGSTPEDQSSQIIVANSTDNGRTWSAPINITEQVKSPDWYITLQGPGRGITMNDGTLVFAFQYVDTARMPNATIIYSKDHGATWKAGAAARVNTTEAQVVELADGVLMLNMRDNRGGSRAVLTTTDMGATWTDHSSSRSALREPVCQASLLKVPHQGGEVLLFSNPDTTNGRSRITIKASTDGGVTWNGGLLLDEEMTWGYSCMTLVDERTIGILYEGSRSQMTFQKILLQDILK